MLFSALLFLSFGFFSCEEENFAPVGVEDEATILYSENSGESDLDFPALLPDCGCMFQVVNTTHPGEEVRVAAFEDLPPLNAFFAVDCKQGRKIFDRTITMSPGNQYPINDYGLDDFSYTFSGTKTINSPSGGITLIFKVIYGSEATYAGVNEYTSGSMGISGPFWSSPQPTTLEEYKCSGITDECDGTSF